MRRKLTPKEAKQHEQLLRHVPSLKGTETTVYWSVVLTLSLVMLLVSLWLLPFFMVIQGSFVFAVVFLIGLIFGLVFNNLVLHLEHVDPKHHLAAGLIIPAVAIISVFIGVRSAAFLNMFLNLTVSQNPWSVSIFYIIGFLIPYVYGLVRKGRPQPL